MFSQTELNDDAVMSGDSIRSYGMIFSNMLANAKRRAGPNGALWFTDVGHRPDHHDRCDTNEYAGLQQRAPCARFFSDVAGA
jgi:hypothetical protein